MLKSNTVIKHLIVAFSLTALVSVLWIVSPFDRKNVPLTLFNSDMTFHSRYLLIISAVLIPWLFYLKKCWSFEFKERVYNVLFLIYNSLFTILIGGLYYLMIVLYVFSGALGYFFPEIDKTTGKPIPETGISLSAINIFFSISLLLFISLEIFFVRKIKRQRSIANQG